MAGSGRRQMEVPEKAALERLLEASGGLEGLPAHGEGPHDGVAGEQRLEIRLRSAVDPDQRQFRPLGQKGDGGGQQSRFGGGSGRKKCKDRALIGPSGVV